MGDVGVFQVCCRVVVGMEGEVGRGRCGRKREVGCGGGSRILTRCDAAFVLISIATLMLSNWLPHQVKVMSLLGQQAEGLESLSGLTLSIRASL